ncbi:MAG: sigma-54 interaction domain-containing protein [Alkaliphilus sp.]
MNTKRIRITTSIDRANITYDIISIFKKRNIYIQWMEVYTSVLYIKFPIKDNENKLWKSIKEEILTVENVDSIEEVDLIAVEERELEMATVLDTVLYGIIILDRFNKVKYINKYSAEDIFSLSITTVQNKLITDYISEKDFIKLTSEDREKNSAKENVEIQINGKPYLINIHPIKNETQASFGKLITMQDINKIDKVLNIRRYDNPITFQDIVGSSKEIKDIVEHAMLFAPSDSPVLITGESGTGKELFARGIHNHSRRANRAFVAINCAAIPDQLLESELFGYEGGAFTDSKKGGKSGIFEIANRGTVFLDEIGEMPPHLQTKLLRVLQEGKIRKLGSTMETDVDVRIISATNQNIEELVKEKKFRLDLLYRINIFRLQIPPLRGRKGDIEVLTDHFIQIYKEKYNKDIEFVDSLAIKKLLNYSWPGNVRELQNVIERAMALSKGKFIEGKEVLLNYVLEDSVIEHHENATNLKEKLGLMEKEIIIKSLKSNSSIRKAAMELDVTHTLLINRIKKYELKEWKNQVK